jgi:hypothetical protein
MILDILTVLFFVLGFALLFWIIGERRRDVLHYVTKSAMTENDRNIWTPEEDNRLRTLLGAGRSIASVAADLKRSKTAVRARAYVLRISLKRVKMKPKA